MRVLLVGAAGLALIAVAVAVGMASRPDPIVSCCGGDTDVVTISDGGDVTVNGSPAPSVTPGLPSFTGTSSPMEVSKGAALIADLELHSEAIYVPHGPQIPPGDYTLVIADKSEIVVLVAPDGRVTFGKGMTPDRASRRFWRLVGRQRALDCK